jgi:hypothetical protein
MKYYHVMALIGGRSHEVFKGKSLNNARTNLAKARDLYADAWMETSIRALMNEE